MKYRFLGCTGLRVSELGFGTMSFGQEASPEVSAQLFHRCLEAGINLFDCANVYAGGQSEEILGGLIAPCRDRIILTTKAYFPESDDPNARGSSRYHLVRAVEASLRRLKTDRIDLFFLHRSDRQTAPDETLRALDDLVHQGKVLMLGASNFAAYEVMQLLWTADRHHLTPIRAIQPMYNLVKRQAEVEILPMAQDQHLGVITYSPLAAGLLTGKYGEHLRPKEGRIVENKLYGVRYRDPAMFRAADRLTAIAKSCGVHPATLAVCWVKDRPGVTAPLLGARSLEQLEPALAAADMELEEDVRLELDHIWPTPNPTTDRNEEQTGLYYGNR